MTYTDQYSSFLSVIRECPDDATTHLVFADWLEEQGDETRARFIRRMVAVGGVTHADNIPHKISARHRRVAKWIIVPCRAYCLGAQRVVNKLLPPPETATRFSALFRGGFLDSIECSSEWWLEHAGALCAAHPLRKVRLTTWQEADKHAVYVRWRETHGTVHPSNGDAAACLRDLFTGVTFELPPEVTYDDFTRIGGDELFRRIVEQFQQAY